MRILVLFSIAILIMFSPAFAVLEIENEQPKIGAKQWKQVLDSTWQGLKRRNIEDCRAKEIYRQNQNSPGGLICRPKSETPYDAVSEGIGYGMLLALYSDDQQTFDLIYNAGKEFGLNFCQGWRKPANGDGTEPGSATDADEDIAVALVFANKLVEKGNWDSTSTSKNYADDAQRGIDCLWGSINKSDYRLWPGNNWTPGYNIGYFAPAWYRIFKTFTTNQSQEDWQKVIDSSYTFISNNGNTGYDRGLVPDWSNTSGNPGGGSYNSYSGGRTFFKDAIRTLWRVATDVIWFPNEHPENSIGRTYLKNAVKFMNDKDGPKSANFYALNGELIPNDKWYEFNNEFIPNSNPQKKDSTTWRYRREHSHLTVGQWLTAAMAVGTDEDKIAWSEEMAKFYDWENKVDFFGLATAVDSIGGALEDTLHNEMYFDQFLAWFGVSLMSGTWMNIIDVLDNPKQNVEGLLNEPFPEPEPPTPPDTIPTNLLAAKNKMQLNIQINQNGNLLQMKSQGDVAWKIHNLQGKLLFSSNSREISWNAGNFKGAVIVSATGSSSVKRKIFVVR